MKRYKIAQKNKDDQYYDDYKKALRRAITKCYYGDNVLVYEDGILCNIVSRNIFGTITIKDGELK